VDSIPNKSRPLSAPPPTNDKGFNNIKTGRLVINTTDLDLHYCRATYPERQYFRGII